MSEKLQHESFVLCHNIRSGTPRQYCDYDHGVSFEPTVMSRISVDLANQRPVIRLSPYSTHIILCAILSMIYSRTDPAQWYMVKFLNSARGVLIYIYSEKNTDCHRVLRYHAQNMTSIRNREIWSREQAACTYMTWPTGRHKWTIRHLRQRSQLHLKYTRAM